MRTPPKRSAQLGDWKLKKKRPLASLSEGGAPKGRKELARRGFEPRRARVYHDFSGNVQRGLAFF